MSARAVLEGIKALERQIVDQTSFRETGHPTGPKEIAEAHRRRAKGNRRLGDVFLSSAALAPLAVDEILGRNRGATPGDAEHHLALAALCLVTANRIWAADGPESLVLELTATGLAFVDQHRRWKMSRTMSAVGSSPGESEPGKPSRKDAAAVPSAVRDFILDESEHPDWSQSRIVRKVMKMLGQSERTARRKVRQVLDTQRKLDTSIR